MEGAKPQRHTIFVDDEKQFKNFDLAKHFETLPELVDMQYNRLKVNQLETQPIVASEDGKLLKQVSRKLKEKYKKLADRKLNERKMEKLLLKIDQEKNLLVRL